MLARRAGSLWIAPSVVTALPWLTGDAYSAAVPATLAEITTHAAVQLVANRAVTGTMASVGSLTEGVLRVMFWNKLKVMTVGILVGSLFTGTALLAYSAAGPQQGRSPAPQTEAPARDVAGVKAGSIGPAPVGEQSLSPTAKARLEVAKKVRVQALEFYRLSPTTLDFTAVLTWQNRHDEVVGDVLVKSDGDRVRFLEHRVATLKRMEQFVKEVSKNRQCSPLDVSAAELYRLEAEDQLETARAKVRANGAALADRGSSQLVQFLNQDSWPPRGSGLRVATPLLPGEPRP